MIDIVHYYTQAVLYHSETAQTIAGAVAEAIKNGAYLAGANLAGANLAGAYLRDANLAGAYLAGANLAGAYLRDANLAGAYLRDANLRDAYLGGAKNYRDSHAIFAEAIRRQPIEAFSAGEWAAIGQIIIHQPCWEIIQQRYANGAPHVVDVLAGAGFLEWRKHWQKMTLGEQ